MYVFSDGVILQSAADFSDCPDGWYCLFRDAGWQGRMLQFRDVGSWQNLTAYGFNDQMSSWRNRRNADSKWAEHVNGGGFVRCSDSNSAASYVGDADNDKASSIRNFSGDGQC